MQRMEHTSDRLKRIREEKGIGSGAELARLARIPEATYRAYEAGRRPLTPRAARELAVPLGVTWQALLFGHEAAALEGVGTVCLYFALPNGAPSREPILYLNGEGTGLVNNACFPSTVSPSYAPAGKGDLLSASLIGIPAAGSPLDPRTEEGGAALAAAVRAELAGWWGVGEEEAATWRHLATYAIPFAQPGQAPPTLLQRPVKLSQGLYVCGDCNASATLDGAMRSGRRAAEAILRTGRPASAGGAVLYSAAELTRL